MSEEKRVVIVRDKESIVVRGIEKKYKEQGYFVFMSGSSEDEIKGNIDRADFFVTYLPMDILDNRVELNNLRNISAMIRDNSCKMIIIGEKKVYPDLVAQIPSIGNYSWIDRPIDMDNLMDVTERLLRGEIAMTSAKSETPVFAEGPQVAPNPINNAAAPAAAMPKRILVVDDDPSYAKRVREWLKDIYKVDIVTAGVQSITFFFKNNVDLILLDYEMPVVDGPQVLEMLRSEPTVADIPVVFLTGIGDRESVQRVMSLKPQGYILKSTTRDDLRSFLQNTFEKLGR